MLITSEDDVRYVLLTYGAVKAGCAVRIQAHTTCCTGYTEVFLTGPFSFPKEQRCRCFGRSQRSKLRDMG
jgi:hypothetical protein